MLELPKASCTKCTPGCTPAKKGGMLGFNAGRVQMVAILGRAATPIARGCESKFIHVRAAGQLHPRLHLELHGPATGCVHSCRAVHAAQLWAMGATICPLATPATKSGPPARVHQAHWAQAPHRQCGPRQQPPALAAALGKQGGRWLARWPRPQLHGGPTGQATAPQLLHGQGRPTRGCTLHQGCRPGCSRGAAKPHPPPAPRAAQCTGLGTVAPDLATRLICQWQQWV